MEALKNSTTHAGSRETGESSLRPPIVCGGGCDRSVGSDSLRKSPTQRVDFYPAFDATTTGQDSRAPTPSALPEVRVVLERIPTPISKSAPNAEGAAPGPSAQSEQPRSRPYSASSSDEVSSLRTVCSMESVTSLPEGKLWRKRKTASLSDPSSDDGSQVPETARGSPVLRARAKRGRGRPPTTGEYVGLAKAKAEHNRAVREALRLQAEEEVAKAAKRTFYLRRSNPSSETETQLMDSGSEAVSLTAAELHEKAKEAIGIVRNVAVKSGQLKGTFVRALKDAAQLLQESLSALHATSTSDETRKLQEQNARQQAKLDAQQKEIDVLRGEMRQLKASLNPTQRVPSPAPEPLAESPQPESAPRAVRSLPARRANPPPATSSRAVSDKEEGLVAQIISQVGFMIDAKLAGLEDRLLPPKVTRPPLAADRKNALSYAAAAKASAAAAKAPATTVAKKATATAATAASTSRAAPSAALQGPTAAASSSASAPPKKRKTRGGRNRKKKGGTNGQSGACPPPSGPAGAGWTVVGKGRKQKVASAQPLQRPKAPKLRPPRSAAVVVQLQPAAAERGTTYADILREAKSKVDIQSLGITSLRIRKAATGARVLEVAGATSTEKADSLATKLRESMSGDVVKVSRPTKCANMRIVGLDDSVSTQEVVEAVAKAGGCTADTIKAGAIREGAGGMGSILLSCPIAAAKKVADGGRLLVGWTSAQVKVLEPRPMRCYRCFEVGHTHALCDSEVDRSTQCYRCGQTGHQSSECSATPHCTVCEAARRPAEHRLGGSTCTAQSRSRRKNRNGPKVPPRPSPPQAAGRAGEEHMSIN
ncbi:uncharacterized protein LOC126374654 [Pectinophora gossypiella]|uniref:uncharacterized protein LOC126368259 n=1 Tax=Pectinophora gossypiella TaxID=13191 RepID=UPI00214F5ED0|nr:uncharacterized protein LOC126368259 [Pectinophora gossypiella]XP_049869423.1 uncharacterized protein LOC126369170 [Pectinophora gossypiella]XP_049877299.1 uncharacterized protein LOC126374651 [Pectinophora gossypiella]XP_049877301.1 uncharacterized protein LOC126374654 [Pectinophora gossypiella]